MTTLASTEIAAPHPTPSFPTKGLLGVIPQFQADPLQIFNDAGRYGTVVKMPMPALTAYVVTDVEIVEHILMANHHNFVKQTRGYQMLRKALGNGLVTSDGAFWLRQRRIAQPAFHREKIAGFASVMTKATNEMIDSWEPKLRNRESFDFAQQMMQVTLRIVGDTLLGSDTASKSGDVGHALTDALEHLIYRTLHPLSLPEWMPTPRNRAFIRAKAKLDEVVMGIIAARRSSGHSGDDLLSMLMEAKDPETGESMSDDQLRDEVMTLMLAGHETTANALSWTFWLLGQHPDVEKKIRAELKTVLNGRTPEARDFPALKQCTWAIKEGMRLYPPVWSLGRKVVQDETVKGYRFEKDALVFFSPYVLHRLPQFWTDPEAFMPERWADESVKRPKCAYIPFSSGPRKCIGDGFALMEAVLLLATIVQRTHIELVPGQKVVPEPLITLRPKYGVQVVARPAPEA
ncbi:MAG: cytochrome P450 [Myxococcaceae bacterium]